MRSEKRINCRISASGAVSFRTYLISDYSGSSAINLRADLIDTSIGGMRIRTSYPLNKSDLLVRVLKSTDSVREMELVRWVKKIGDSYYAGLQSVPDLEI